ncbi:MAG TPA: alpha/beta hydrolase [Chthoniobacterales bacterium]
MKALVTAVAFCATLLAAHGQPARSAAREPLGIALEGYEYPHPVKFFPMKIEGQDVRMAYMDVPAAEGSAPRGAVVLLHGKNFFGAYWKDTIAALTKAGFRVIVPDQIGFGKSSKPHISYSFHLLAANTRLLLESLGVEQVAVVGHSMGGMLATRFALMYPEFTRKLVLENPIGLEDYKEKAPYVPTQTLYEQQLGQTEEQIRKYQRAYYVNPKTAYEEYAIVQARWMGSGEYPRLAWSAALTTQMIYEQPVSHEFPLVRPPTLLVIGQGDRTAIGKDRVLPEVAETMGNYPELGRRVAKEISNAKLVEIENCGHIPHFEAPDRFHAALVEFLGER